MPEEIDLTPEQARMRLMQLFLQQLPRDGKWTWAKRQRWIGAVTATLDFVIEIKDA